MELRTRRRRPGEDLQSLYNDICRLMSLAYPGPTTALIDMVGRDAFLETLGELRVRILDIWLSHDTHMTGISFHWHVLSPA